MPVLISCLIILALFTLSTSGQIKPSYTTAAPIDYAEDEAEDMDDAFNCPEECGLYSAEDTVIFIFFFSGFPTILIWIIFWIFSTENNYIMDVATYINT